MRISADERQAIVEAARAVYGPHVEVRLFGSRARDDARGGDIDLLVEVPAELATLDNELRLERRLRDALGERRIDLVVQPAGAPAPAIVRIARERGVVL